MKLELELSKEFITKFITRHNCTKNEILNILSASILEDKESQYYKELQGTFDINAFLMSHSISQLATMRANAISR
jgi:hypothetical protein